MRDIAPAAADIVIVFIDLQTGIINVGVTNEPSRIRASVAALTDLAVAFALPVVITSVPTMGGTVSPLLAEITARLPDALALVRTTPSPMDDPPFRAALEASGRRIVVLAGVATEVAVRQAATGLLHSGFHAIVAVDACGGLDHRTESSTFTYLSSAGVELSSVATIAAQLAGDFTTDRGRAAMRALGSTLTVHTHRHEHDGDEAD
jgi:nicotinamidase-related amidase